MWFQYEMFFTNEYIFELIKELSQIMHIEYNESMVMRAFKCIDNASKESIFIARNVDDYSLFICVDCNNKDWIYPLIVRCNEITNIAVNECMLRWDNKIREEYGQKLTVSIENSINNEDTLLGRLEKFYNINVE